MSKEWIDVETHNGLFRENMTEQEFEDWVLEYIRLTKVYEQAQEKEKVY